MDLIMKLSIMLFSFFLFTQAYADCDGVCSKGQGKGGKVSIDSILSDSNEAMYNSLPDKSLKAKNVASKNPNELITISEKSDATMVCTKTKTDFLGSKKAPLVEYSCQEK